MSHLIRRRPLNQIPGRIDPREVAPSRHAIFIRNIPHNVGIEKVRSFFCEETDSDVTVDFYGTSEDKRYLFVALRFESHAMAREMKEKYNNQRLFGNTVTISWFKNLKKERDKRIAMGIMPPLPVRGGGYYSSVRGSGGGYYRTGGRTSSRSHHHDNSMSSSRHRHHGGSRGKRYGEEGGDRDDDASSRSRRHSGDRRYSSDSYSDARTASRSRRSDSLRGSSADDEYSRDGRSHSRRSRSRGSSAPPKKRSRRGSPGEERGVSSRSRSGESRGHSREIHRKKAQHRVDDAQTALSDHEVMPSNAGILEFKQAPAMTAATSSCLVMADSANSGGVGLSIGGQMQYEPSEKLWSERAGELHLCSESALQGARDLSSPAGKNLVEDISSPQEAIRKKKNEIEMTYKKDCETFSVVAKLLINKDRELEDRILNCLKEVLRELGQQCIQELRAFINAITEKADSSAKDLYDMNLS